MAITVKDRLYIYINSYPVEDLYIEIKAFSK